MLWVFQFVGPADGEAALLVRPYGEGQTMGSEMAELKRIGQDVRAHLATLKGLPGEEARRPADAQDEVLTELLKVGTAAYQLWRQTRETRRSTAGEKGIDCL